MGTTRSDRLFTTPPSALRTLVDPRHRTPQRSALGPLDYLVCCGHNFGPTRAWVIFLFGTCHRLFLAQILLFSNSLTIIGSGLVLGMRKAITLVAGVTLADVRRAMSGALDAGQRSKLEVVDLVLRGGLSAREIANRVGVSRQLVFQWAGDLRRAGTLEGLLSRTSRRGRKTQVQGEVLEEMRTRLASRQTPRLVLAWLHEQGVPITLSGVYYWMGKLGIAAAFRARPRRATTISDDPKPAPLALHLTDSALLDFERAFQVAGAKVDPHPEAKLKAILRLAERTRLLQLRNARQGPGQSQPDLSGVRIARIVTELGCSRRSLYRWATQFRELDGDLHRFARVSRRSGLWRSDRFQRLAEAYSDGVAGTGPKAVEWLHAQGIKVSLSTVYRWLERCGRVVTPRDSPAMAALVESLRLHFEQPAR